MLSCVNKNITYMEVWLIDRDNWKSPLNFFFILKSIASDYSEGYTSFELQAF